MLSFPYPYAFCSHYIYAFTCFLFISVTKFMCESLELRKIFLFPSPFPLPQEKTLLSIWAFSYKGLFSNSWPSLAVPPSCSGWIIWCQVSTAAIPAPVQHFNVQEMQRERELVDIKNCWPLQSLMLREDIFFTWEGWAIFTKLAGCLVIRQKFNCNNMFSSFLAEYQEVWRWSHKGWHIWSNLSCSWQGLLLWVWYTSLWR